MKDHILGRVVEKKLMPRYVAKSQKHLMMVKLRFGAMASRHAHSYTLKNVLKP